MRLRRIQTRLLRTVKVRNAVRLAVWLAAALAAAPVTAETAVYLEGRARPEATKPRAETPARTSLLSQWTEPFPQNVKTTNQPEIEPASVKASQVQQAAAAFSGGPLGMFGRQNSGLNAAVQPAAPAQIPPGYGAYTGQTIPSANGLLDAAGLGVGKGGRGNSGPSPHSSVSPAPTYGPLGYGGAGGYGGGGVSNPYGSPYAPGQPNNFQPPAGYAAPQPGYGGYQPPAANTQSATPYPFETLGSEGAKGLPAPSAAPIDSTQSAGTEYGEAAGGAGAYYPPVSSGGFDNMWGSNGGYNSYGYQSFGSGYQAAGYQAVAPYDPYPATSYGVSAATQSGCGSLCGCDPCASRTWWRADLLFGWFNGFNTPRLLTQSPEGTPLDDVVDSNSPFTKTIYGGRGFGDDVRIGGRIAGGMWLDQCRKWGVQVDAFAIGNDSEDINIRSNGDVILSRPFYNQDPNVAAVDGQVISMLGIAEGSFTASTSGRLVSFGPSVRFNICCCDGTPPAPCCDPCCCDPCATSSVAMSTAGGGCGGGVCGLGDGVSSRVDLIAGYRFLQLKEGYFAREVLTPSGDGFADGTTLTLVDDVDTQNDFHAFELGAIWQLQSGKLLWDFGCSAAFGELTRRHSVAGSTRFQVPNALNESFPGGFSVRPDRIGSFKDSKFTVVPQARIGVGYCLFDNFRLHADYSFLYIDNIYRPGAFLTDSFDGRDLGAEPNSGLVGSAANTRPDDESLIFHALSLGVSCNY